MRKPIILTSLWILISLSSCFADEPNEWEKYDGSFVCWNAAYDPSSVPPNIGQPENSKEVTIQISPIPFDEFENCPFFNIRHTKDRKLIGELWGVEKTRDGKKKGYYRVVVTKLSIKTDGQISFEVGERILYSKPMGWKEKRGVRIGVKKSKMVYSGKIRGKWVDDICLTCKGEDCFKGMRVFSRDDP
jgi:hypothetical protein